MAPEGSTVRTGLRAWAVLTAVGLPVARILPEQVYLIWLVMSVGLPVAACYTLWGRRPRHVVVWLLAATLFLVAALAAASSADLPRQHWYVAAQIIVWAGAGPFAFTGLARVPRLMRDAALAFACVQTASALAAINQALGGTPLGTTSIDGRAYGLAGHPNLLGLLSGLVILLSIASLRGRRSLLVLSVLVLNLGALLASGSLSALLAAVLGVAALLFTSATSRSKLLVVSLTGVACATCIALSSSGDLRVPVPATLKSPTDRFLQVTGQTQEVGTLGLRAKTIQFAWSRAQERPLAGWGLDDRSGATFDNRTVTHNILVRALFQGGLAMLVGFGLLLTVSLQAIWGSLRRREDPLAAAVLLALWTFALTAASFQQGYFWIPLLAAWARLGQAPAGEYRLGTEPSRRVRDVDHERMAAASARAT